jgi:hypothetical protein
MEARNKLSENIKESYKKKGKEISDSEADEASRNLVDFFSLLWELDKKNKRRQQRLKKEPDGFPVDGTYNCLVCHTYINETTGWYDWYGQTCLLCRKAIKDGVVPAFVCTKHGSYFSTSDLKYKFNIAHQTVKKLAKEGKLKARIILKENGKPYQYIFLKKENPDLFERESPEMKSFRRYRNRVLDERIRKEKQKFKEEHAELLKKRRNKK